MSPKCYRGSPPVDNGSLDAFGGWSGVLSDLVAGVDLTPATGGPRCHSKGEATDAQMAGFVCVGDERRIRPRTHRLVEAMMDAASPLNVRMEQLT